MAVDPAAAPTAGPGTAGRRIPVIMDCDPGHDDAIALMLAHARPEIDLRGVCTTAGNQTIDKTTLNARKVLAFLGSDVPVARGAARPLFRELITAASVHGASGLDGPVLPDPVRPESDLSAFELMVKILEESPDPVTIVPTGALTNLAMLLLARSDLKNRIARVSMMGGAARGGNWTPAAEFNILVDPEAAQVVFSSGLPITMAGLDVTHRAVATAADIETFRSVGTRAALMVAGLMDFFRRFHEEYLASLGGTPLHDPCAVAALVAPELFTSARARVEVECRGRHTTGATVVSWARGVRVGGAEGRIPMDEANVDVLTDVNREGLIALITDALGVLE